MRKRGYYGASREPDLLALLDLVALATVADVVPLIGLNRAYVKKGLAVMRASENVGLTALGRCGRTDGAPTPYHLGFILGPRINAGGRIGNAALGATLLSTTDPVEAQRIAELLHRLNKERKDIETLVLEEALALADRQVADDPSRAILIVASETWHKGVVGLVASRLVERFRRPACVIAWEANAWARARSDPFPASISELQFARPLTAGLLVEGRRPRDGGRPDGRQRRPPALEQFLLGQLGSAAKGVGDTAHLDIDASIVSSGATRELMDLIERVSPFGQGNSEARFALPAHRVKFGKLIAEAHIRVILEGGDGARLDGVAFRAAGNHWAIF